MRLTVEGKPVDVQDALSDFAIRLGALKTLVDLTEKEAHERLERGTHVREGIHAIGDATLALDQDFSELEAWLIERENERDEAAARGAGISEAADVRGLSARGLLSPPE